MTDQGSPVEERHDPTRDTLSRGRFHEVKTVTELTEPRQSGSKWLQTEVGDVGEDSEGEETKKRQKWEKQHRKVAEKLALERLRRSYLQRDESGLRETLEEIKGYYPALSKTDEIKKCETALVILTAARELQEACKSGNIDEIKECIKKIRKDGLSEYLTNELRTSRYAMEDIETRDARNKRFKRKIDLNRAAMTELRRYQNPPPDVHPVMQGVLLLLGEDEGSTASWSEVQRLLRPYGDASLHRRLMDFDINKVHPELAARSEMILRQSDADGLEKTSPCVAMLHVWAMGIIEQMKKDGHDLSEPANLNRQRTLLGRKMAADPQMDRSYYRSLVLQTARGGYPLNKAKPTFRARQNGYYRDDEVSSRQANGGRRPKSYDDHEHSPGSSISEFHVEAY